MNDFSTQKFSKIDSPLFRRLIIVTPIVGLVAACIAWSGCRVDFFCLDPLLILSGALFSAATLFIYGAMTAAVILRAVSPVRIALLGAGKGTLVVVLLFYLWRASQAEQIALLVGLLSFIPATLSLCWAARPRGGGEFEG